MIRASISIFALILAAGLPLSACDTVQTGMNNVSVNVKQAVQNFRPPENSLASTEMALSGAQLSTDCPEVQIVQDLNQVHQYIDGARPDPLQSISSIRMTNVQDQCSLVQNNMVIDITLAFSGNIGPKARMRADDKPGFAYPYFIAITNDQGSIIAKEVFAVTLAYESGRDSETHVEQLRQMIPVAGQDQKNYKILIGFQLSEQELAYNRSLPQQEIVAQSSNGVTLIEPASGEKNQ